VRLIHRSRFRDYIDKAISRYRSLATHRYDIVGQSAHMPPNFILMVRRSPSLPHCGAAAAAIPCPPGSTPSPPSGWSSYGRRSAAEGRSDHPGWGCAACKYTLHSFIIHRRLLLAYLLDCTQGREGGRERRDQRTKETNTPCSFVVYTQAAVMCGVLAADLI